MRGNYGRKRESRKRKNTKKVEEKEKTAKTEKVGKKEKEKPLLRAIEASIQKGAESKVNFDLARSEKLIQKGFGAIPGINIAAETAKEYMDMLGELLLTMDEGLKTGAKTDEDPIKSGKKLWFVDAVQSYERDLFTQGQNIIGFGEGLVDIGKGTLAFAGDFVEYLQGQNPAFLKEVWGGIAATGMGVLNGMAHPEETLQALDEAMSNTTPRDMGKLGAYVFATAFPIGVPAGGSKLLNLFKKISPDMENMGLTIKIIDGAGDASREADKILDGVEAPKGNMKPLERGSGTLSDTARLDNMMPRELNNLTPEQIKQALPDGWTYSGSPDGKFVHIKDSNGNYRIRIDPPDKITNYSHMHILDEYGNSLDIDGNIVSPNSPDGHIPR